MLNKGSVLNRDHVLTLLGRYSNILVSPCSLPGVVSVVYTSDEDDLCLLLMLDGQVTLEQTCNLALDLEHEEIYLIRLQPGEDLPVLPDLKSGYGNGFPRLRVVPMSYTDILVELKERFGKYRTLSGKALFHILAFYGVDPQQVDETFRPYALQTTNLYTHPDFKHTDLFSEPLSDSGSDGLSSSVGEDTRRKDTTEHTIETQKPTIKSDSESETEPPHKHKMDGTSEELSEHDCPSPTQDEAAKPAEGGNYEIDPRLFGLSEAQAFKRFVLSKGRLPHPKLDSRLYAWMIEVKKRYYAGKIEKETNLILQSVDLFMLYLKGHYTLNLVQGLKKIRVYVMDHGCLPFGDVGQDARILSAWISLIRSLYTAGKYNDWDSLMIEDSGIHLPDEECVALIRKQEEYALLKDPAQSSWVERTLSRIHELETFVRENRCFPKKSDQDPFARSLHTWLNHLLRNNSSRDYKPELRALINRHQLYNEDAAVKKILCTAMSPPSGREGMGQDGTFTLTANQKMTDKEPLSVPDIPDDEYPVPPPDHIPAQETAAGDTEGTIAHLREELTRYKFLYNEQLYLVNKYREQLIEHGIIPF